MTKSVSELGSSVQMMNKMNTLMEDYLVRCMLLDTSIGPSAEAGSVQLRFQLQNACKFPLPQLRLCRHSRDEQCLESAEVDITTMLSSPSPPGESFNLAGGGKLSGNAVWKPAALKPMFVRTSISFASPGTGKILTASHSCEMLLLDLCGLPLLLSDPTTAAASEEASGVRVELEFLRRWLRVPASDPFPFLRKYEMVDGKVLLHLGVLCETSGTTTASFEAVDTGDKDTYSGLGRDLVRKSKHHTA